MRAADAPAVEPDPTRAVPRFSLAALSALVAAVYTWAAWVLPWRAPLAVFSVLVGALAVLHAVTAGLALLGHRARARAFRVQSVASLAFLALCTWSVARAVTYLATLYGGLGKGIGAGLVACWAILVLLTVPLSVWGIAVTGGIGRPRRAAAAGAVTGLFALAGLAREARAADPAPLVTEADVDHWQDLLGSAAGRLGPHVPGAPGLFVRTAAACPDAPGPARLTALVTRLVSTPGGWHPRATCLQAADPAALADAVSEAVAGAPAPVAVEFVTEAAPLPDLPPGLAGLALRPGFDGACERRRCLAPWQLVAGEHFISYQPLPFIPELRFGVDPARLRAHLRGRTGPKERTGPRDFTGLTRVASASFVLGEGGAVHRLVRGRLPEPPVTPARLQRARAQAQAHILAAQEPSGRFRYQLDPHTGQVRMRGFAIPRQAGTTLALCEIGARTPEVDQAAARSLDFLTSLVREVGDAGGLAYPAGRRATRLPVGNTALTLIAMLACHDRVGVAHDPEIGRLARALLRLQREDGGYHPFLDARTGEPIAGPDPLYAGGQAVLALVMLERLATVHPSAAYPDAATVGQAAERSMTYFASAYWPEPIRSFFFLEENWHCLAARAALTHHRHDAYERFCLDYVTFKRRLILDEGSRVDPTLVGGYGFGNVLLPHNTGSAGFGEALAAAMAVRHARGLDVAAEREAMALVLRFLVTEQWDEPECFACVTDQLVVGGMSEHIGSPHIRIDYVQHAWAAMGHGGRELFPATSGG